MLIRVVFATSLLASTAAAQRAFPTQPSPPRQMQVIDSLRVPGGTIAFAATNQGVAAVVIRTPYGAAVARPSLGPLLAFADSVERIINARDQRTAGDTLVYGAREAGLRFDRMIDDRGDRLRISGTHGVGSDELLLTLDQAATVVAMIRRAISASNAMPPYEPPRFVTPQAPVTEERIYFAFQVERQARIVGESPKPRYPEMLKRANVGGEVLAQFVVDTTGRVEPPTFKVLRATHALFGQSVKELLSSLRFTPAELRGTRVRQLVQMPFDFTP